MRKHNESTTNGTTEKKSKIPVILGGAAVTAAIGSACYLGRKHYIKTKKNELSYEKLYAKFTGMLEDVSKSLIPVDEEVFTPAIHKMATMYADSIKTRVDEINNVSGINVVIGLLKEFDHSVEDFIVNYQNDRFIEDAEYNVVEDFIKYVGWYLDMDFSIIWETVCEDVATDSDDSCSADESQDYKEVPDDMFDVSVDYQATSFTSDSTGVASKINEVSEMVKDHDERIEKLENTSENNDEAVNDSSEDIDEEIDDIPESVSEIPEDADDTMDVDESTVKLYTIKEAIIDNGAPEESHLDKFWLMDVVSRRFMSYNKVVIPSNLNKNGFSFFGKIGGIYLVDAIKAMNIKMQVIAMVNSWRKKNGNVVTTDELVDLVVYMRNAMDAAPEEVRSKIVYEENPVKGLTIGNAALVCLDDEEYSTFIKLINDEEKKDEIIAAASILTSCETKDIFISALSRIQEIIHSNSESSETPDENVAEVSDSTDTEVKEA